MYGSTISVSSCDSLVWNGTVYDTSEVYTDTLQTVSGCDSVLIIDLTINNSYVGDTVLTTSCDSSRMEWDSI